jgi:hypothetical protein
LVILLASGLLFSKVLRELPKNNTFAAVYANMVIALTNQNRKLAGDHDLISNELLTKAAQMKADDMAKNGYFAHNSPIDSEKTSWYWFDQAGYKYEYAGENLAVNYSDSKDVTDAWMASPTHRANILRPEFTEIGVASAVGMYNGQEATFVVQMFGKPEYIAPTPKTIIKEKLIIGSTTDVATRTDKEVAGAYSSEIAVQKVVTSPKRTIVTFYYIFIALITALLLAGSILEFKRHHRSIWLAGGVLIVVAGGLVAYFLQIGQGTIGY